MHQAIWLGLLSAACYGVTDYVSRVAGRALGTPRALLYGQLAALVGLSGWMLSSHDFVKGVSALTVGVGLAALGSGAILIGSAVVLNRALVIGRLAVVAPIATSYGAITTLLAMAAGHAPSRTALCGIALTVLGVCVVSIPPHDANMSRDRVTNPGILLAVLAATGYGVGFWIQSKWVVPTLGPLLPVWLNYFFAVAFWLAASHWGGIDLAVPRINQLAPVITWGVTSVGGYVALTMGFRTGATAIVVVASSVASVVTVLLGRLLEETPVRFYQWLVTTARRALNGLTTWASLSSGSSKSSSSTITV